MELKTLQTNFERELLFQIIFNMRQKKLTKSRAKKVAKAFLPTLTSEDAKVFIDKNARLCEFYPEILEAFLKTVKEYEKETSEVRLQTARVSLRGGEQ